MLLALVFFAAAAASVRSEVIEVLRIAHYQPGPNGERECKDGEEFVVIEQPLHKRMSTDSHFCLTVDGKKHFTWELIDNGGRNAHYQCVYHDPDNGLIGDPDCVVETHAQCEIANHDLDVCFLALASITGLAEDTHNVSTRAVVRQKIDIAPVSGNPRIFHRKEWHNSADCGETGVKNHLELNLADDACVFNKGPETGTGVSPGVYVRFNNRYDLARKIAMFCVFYDAQCKGTPTQCREYEVDKCEHDGKKSQLIDLQALTTSTESPDGSDPGAMTGGMMESPASTLAVATGALVSLGVAALAL